MKSLLRTLSLAFAIGVPTALFVQACGVRLPAAADAGALFVAFTTALTLLTVIGDYAPARRSLKLPQRRGSAQAEIIHLRTSPATVRLAA